MSDTNRAGGTARSDSQGGYGSVTGTAPGAGRTAGDAIDEAPLVAMAAGIAAGALVAALLPVTRQERKLAKPVGDRVTTAARGAADAARRAGSDKLRELGLTPDSVAEKVTEAGRATAQAAIGTFRDEAGKS